MKICRRNPAAIINKITGNNMITTKHGIGKIIKSENNLILVELFDSLNLPDELKIAHEKQGGLWFDEREVQICTA